MIHVAAFYRFVRFDDPAALRAPLIRVAEASGVRGTVLLAPEGLNGTIAGPRDGVSDVLAHLKTLPGCAGLTWKDSTAEEMPFGRLKVRLKREIVTMGEPNIAPDQSVGTYVEAEDWNALVAADDVVTIDTRNDYEVRIGTFEGAIDPGLSSFRQFPDWWRSNAEQFAGKRVAMFCTGGIRCEKATSFLKAEGVEDIFHLRDGILKYLETVPEADSLWNGDCFVFDQRVAVTHGLAPGAHGMCHACRRPVSEEDRASDAFEDGVSCPACVDEYSDADRTRFRERQRQVRLAETRGARHLG